MPERNDNRDWLIQEAGFRDVVGSGRELDDAAHSFRDLADVLALPAQAMSIYGAIKLNVLPGTRKYSEDGAYVPDNKHNRQQCPGLVRSIFVTPVDGVIAHEWAHALDNLLAAGTVPHLPPLLIRSLLGIGPQYDHGADQESRKWSLKVQVAWLRLHAAINVWLDRYLADFGHGERRLHLQSWVAANAAAGTDHDAIVGANLEQEADYLADRKEMFARAFECYLSAKLGGQRSHLSSLHYDEPSAMDIVQHHMPEHLPTLAEQIRHSRRFDDLFAALRNAEQNGSVQFADAHSAAPALTTGITKGGLARYRKLDGTVGYKRGGIKRTAAAVSGALKKAATGAAHGAAKAATTLAPVIGNDVGKHATAAAGHMAAGNKGAAVKSAAKAAGSAGSCLPRAVLGSGIVENTKCLHGSLKSGNTHDAAHHAYGLAGHSLALAAGFNTDLYRHLHQRFKRHLNGNDAGAHLAATVGTAVHAAMSQGAGFALGVPFVGGAVIAKATGNLATPLKTASNLVGHIAGTPARNEVYRKLLRFKRKAMAISNKLRGKTHPPEVQNFLEGVTRVFAESFAEFDGVQRFSERHADMAIHAGLRLLNSLNTHTTSPPLQAATMSTQFSPFSSFSESPQAQQADDKLTDRKAALAKLEAHGIDTGSVNDATPDDFLMHVASVFPDGQEPEQYAEEDADGLDPAELDGALREHGYAEQDISQMSIDEKVDHLIALLGDEPGAVEQHAEDPAGNDDQEAGGGDPEQLGGGEHDQAVYQMLRGYGVGHSDIERMSEEKQAEQLFQLVSSDSGKTPDGIDAFCEITDTETRKVGAHYDMNEDKYSRHGLRRDQVLGSWISHRKREPMLTAKAFLAGR